MSIAVLNYGAGNLPNVVRALRAVGADLVVTDDAEVVRRAEAIVLPGVGATADTMRSLRALGMDQVLPEVITLGRPFLGICVGMQVLLELSEEFGRHPCLGMVEGTVRRLPEAAGKIPQIGWNQVCYRDPLATHPIFAHIPSGSDFYFVHSYYCDVADPTLVAAHTDYGLTFPSVLVRGALTAVQFHPEKSGRHGLRLLQNFVELCRSS